jgi:hypothetical protein
MQPIDTTLMWKGLGNNECYQTTTTTTTTTQAKNQEPNPKSIVGRS